MLPGMPPSPRSDRLVRRGPVRPSGRRRDHRRRPHGPRAGQALSEPASRPGCSAAADGPEDTRGAGLVLIATPDDAIGAVAAELARDGAIERRVRSSSTSPACSTAWPSTPSPTPARASAPSIPCNPSPTRHRPASGWRGAYAGLEGDERALEAGERLAATLGHAVRSGSRPAAKAGISCGSGLRLELCGRARRRSRKRLARQAGVSAGRGAQRSICRSCRAPSPIWRSGRRPP